MSISYVVPTLNSAATLDMTLLSLRLQKNIDVNVIVVDSGSTDETLNICKRWDVKTLYAEPGNMYRAINTGLRECNTEWLAYINSDDWLYLDSLEQLIAYGTASNADIVYGNCDFTDIYGRFVYSFAAAKPEQLLSLFQCVALGFAQQSVIFRRKLYHQLKGFNEAYYLSGDYDFYFRALNSGAKFALYDAAPVSCFRLHRNQLSNLRAKEMSAENQTIFTALSGKSSIYDWVVTTQWRLKNTPHYFVRLLRQSLISGKVQMTTSMKV